MTAAEFAELVEAVGWSRAVEIARQEAQRGN